MTSVSRVGFMVTIFDISISTIWKQSHGNKLHVTKRERNDANFIRRKIFRHTNKMVFEARLNMLWSYY